MAMRNRLQKGGEKEIIFFKARVKVIMVEVLLFLEMERG